MLIDHAGQDVTRIFRGIHPNGTIEKALKPSQKVGRLDDTGESTSRCLSDSIRFCFLGRGPEAEKGDGDGPQT